MDVLHFLKAGHDTIRTGLERLRSTEGVKARRALADELAGVLTIHLGLERDFLYPELSGLFPGAEALTDIGLASGTIVSKKLKVLTKIVHAPASEQAAFGKRFEELRDAVLAHLDAEEQSLLPRLRESMRTEEREDLGEVFIDAQAELRRSLFGDPAVSVPEPVPTTTAKRRA